MGVEDLKPRIEKFREYEAFTHTTAKYPVGMSMEYTALGLCGEAGEYAEHVKKMIRDGTYNREAALQELGDVLFYLTRCAVENGSSLEEVATLNRLKLMGRLERGTLSGSGSDR